MKKFLIKISYTVLPVWLLLVGMAIYLSVTGDNSGDLMRLGLIDGGPEYSDSIIAADALPEVYYGSLDNDSLMALDTCDVVVIGDSFSHGGGVGKQGDFVNFLAHDSGQRVVVYTPAGDAQASPMQMAYDALRLGIIDSTHVRNLVVQEVERYLVGRHHTFTDVDGIDYQILLEADYLANAVENGYGRQSVEAFLTKIAKTESGRRLTRAVFCL